MYIYKEAYDGYLISFLLISLTGIAFLLSFLAFCLSGKGISAKEPFSIFEKTTLFVLVVIGIVGIVCSTCIKADNN